MLCQAKDPGVRFLQHLPVAYAMMSLLIGMPAEQREEGEGTLSRSWIR